MLDYRQFIKEVLIGTGQLFRAGGCEGRTPEGANEGWRCLVAMFLGVTPPIMATSTVN
jgi:hypothetical protein